MATAACAAIHDAARRLDARRTTTSVAKGTNGSQMRSTSPFDNPDRSAMATATSAAPANQRSGRDEGIQGRRRAARRRPAASDGAPTPRRPRDRA